MATVKNFLDKITGAEEEREKAKKEVQNLVVLANAKLDNLENELKELFRNKQLEGQIQIVGDRMGAFSREYRVNYADGDVSNAINELVDQIMSIGTESAKTIICKCIKNALNAMFNSVSASEEEKRIFIVLLEGVAMVRYDIYVWRSAEQDKALFSHASSVVAVTYARSVIDHTKVSEDELNDAIFRFLGGNVPLQDVIHYKKDLIELFKLVATQNNIPIPQDISVSPQQKLKLNFAKEQSGDIDDVRDGLNSTGSLIHIMKNVKAARGEELDNLLKPQKTSDREYIDQEIRLQ